MGRDRTVQHGVGTLCQEIVGLDSIDAIVLCRRVVVYRPRRDRPLVIGRQPYSEFLRLRNAVTGRAATLCAFVATSALAS